MNIILHPLESWAWNPAYNYKLNLNMVSSLLAALKDRGHRIHHSPSGHMLGWAWQRSLRASTQYEYDMAIIMAFETLEREEYEDLQSTMYQHQPEVIIVLSPETYCVLESGSRRCKVHTLTDSECVARQSWVADCVDGTDPDELYEEEDDEDDDD